MDTAATGNTTEVNPQKKYSIDPDIPIAQLVREHPGVVDFLVKEYGFHCVNCIGSHFETLREGAAVHMIIDQYFDDLMDDLEKFIQQEKNLPTTVEQMHTQN